MNALNHSFAASVAVRALGRSFHEAIPTDRVVIESPIGGIVATVPTEPATEPHEAEAVAPPKKIAPKPASAMVDRASLSAAVSAVTRTVERRNTIPILSCVRIVSTTDGVIMVTATDLDIIMTAHATGTADSLFEAVIPAHALADVLKKAKASEFVTITSNMATDKPSTILDFDGLKVTMQGHSPGDWPHPAWPEDGVTYGFDMPAKALLRLIGRTQFAISTEETRYYLNGIFLHVVLINGHSYLRAVATDGHRLALCDVARPKGCELPLMMNGSTSGGYIVPRKAVGELHRLLKAKGAPEMVSLRLHGLRLAFTVGAVVVDTKTIDGTFPPYERVIPTGNKVTATIDKTAFWSAVESVMVVGRAVKLAFADAAVTLTVENPDLGDASMTVPCVFDAAEHGPIDIGFNGKYIADVIDNIGGDAVRVAMSAANGPALFTDPEDDGALMVLMPMRV